MMTFIYDVETSSQTTNDCKQCVECDWNIDTYYECYTKGDGPYKDSHILGSTCRPIGI